MKSCDTCFFQPLCDTYAKFGVTDLGPENKTVCDFYKDKELVKEIPCICRNCEYVKILREGIVGVYKTTWYCTRDWQHPYPVKSEGFCSYGKPKGDNNGNK